MFAEGSTLLCTMYSLRMPCQWWKWAPWYQDCSSWPTRTSGVCASYICTTYSCNSRDFCRRAIDPLLNGNYIFDCLQFYLISYNWRLMIVLFATVVTHKLGSWVKSKANSKASLKLNDMVTSVAKKAPVRKWVGVMAMCCKLCSPNMSARKFILVALQRTSTFDVSSDK